MAKVFEINGTLETEEEYDEDSLLEAFIEFCENNNITFGGSIQESEDSYDEDEEVNEEDDYSGYDDEEDN